MSHLVLAFKIFCLKRIYNLDNVWYNEVGSPLAGISTLVLAPRERWSLFMLLQRLVSMKAKQAFSMFQNEPFAKASWLKHSAVKCIMA